MDNKLLELVIWLCLIVFGLCLNSLGKQIMADEKERDVVNYFVNGFGKKVSNMGMGLVTACFIYMILVWG